MPRRSTRFLVGALAFVAIAFGASALSPVGAGASTPAVVASSLPSAEPTGSLDTSPSSDPTIPAEATVTVDPPGKPVLLSPTGGYCAATAKITVKAGSSTASMTVEINGRIWRSAECTGGQSVTFGKFNMRKGVSTLRIIAANSADTTRSVRFTVKRLDYPWATCIIIDKSDFRLYWIKSGELVKTYRIAVGKPSTQTPNRVWKVLSKEITPPKGVYGPRKLRLFQRLSGRHGYRYVRTAYGIHGTNQPWVIGTMASHGCIRLKNKDILDLWPRVPMGTMVQTRQ